MCVRFSHTKFSNFNSTTEAKTNNKSIHIDPWEAQNMEMRVTIFAAMLVMEMKMSPLRFLSIYSIHIILGLGIYACLLLTCIILIFYASHFIIHTSSTSEHVWFHLHCLLNLVSCIKNKIELFLLGVEVDSMLWVKWKILDLIKALK